MPNTDVLASKSGYAEFVTVKAGDFSPAFSLRRKIGWSELTGMMYEILITKVDGSAVKESFTAVNDKKAIQRVSSALERHAHQSANSSYQMIDANKRQVVKETDLLNKIA